MIRLAALLLTLAACGRWRFDELSRGDGDLDTASDQVTGHDEDGDGLPDVIDPCPQIAGDTADADSDGVGDACDPNPAIPTERITLFATMQAGDVPFVDTFGWIQQGDAIFGHVGMGSATTNALTFPHAVATTRVDLRFTILAINDGATAQHQVAVGLERPEPTYFVELNENGGGRDVGLFSYDTTNGYTSLGTTNFPSMHTGQGSLRLDANATTRQWVVQAGWTGELYTAMGPTAAYDAANTVRLSINGLDVDIESITIVETN